MPLILSKSCRVWRKRCLYDPIFLVCAFHRPLAAFISVSRNRNDHSNTMHSYPHKHTSSKIPTINGKHFKLSTFISFFPQNKTKTTLYTFLGKVIISQSPPSLRPQRQNPLKPFVFKRPDPMLPQTLLQVCERHSEGKEVSPPAAQKRGM